MRGNVIDATFAQHIPSTHNALKAGAGSEIIIRDHHKVASHLDVTRGVALTATRGLSR